LLAGKKTARKETKKVYKKIRFQCKTPKDKGNNKKRRGSKDVYRLHERGAVPNERKEKLVRRAGKRFDQNLMFLASGSSLST